MQRPTNEEIYIKLGQTEGYRMSAITIRGALDRLGSLSHQQISELADFLDMKAEELDKEIAGLAPDLRRPKQ